jgi:hypothetical protein
MWWNNLRQYRKPWTPWQLPNAKLVLLADRGVTTVDASITSPNNLAGVGWSAQRLSSRTADTMTDDTATGIHNASVAPTNFLWAHPFTLSFEAKAGSCGYLWVFDSNAYLQTHLSLVGGSVIDQTGCTVTAVALSGGWSRYTVTPTVYTGTGSIYFAMYVTNGVTTYTGSGTGTIQLRNVNVTQKNAAAWTDVLSSNAISLVQTSSAFRPVLTDSDPSYGGKPSLNCAGSGFLSTTDLMVNQPDTIYHVAKAVTAISELYDNTNGRQLFAQSWTGYPHPYCYAGNTALRAASLITPSYDAKIVASVFNGANSALCYTGPAADVAAQAGSQNIGSGTFTIARSITDNNYWLGSIAALLIFSDAHDLANRTRVMRWLARWAGNAITLT